LDRRPCLIEFTVNRSPLLSSPRKSADARPFRGARRPNGVYIRWNGRLTGASTLDRRARFTVALRSCRSRRAPNSRNRDNEKPHRVAATFTKVIFYPTRGEYLARLRERVANRDDEKKRPSRSRRIATPIPLPLHPFPTAERRCIIQVVSVKTPNCFTATTTCQRLTPDVHAASLPLFLPLSPSVSFPPPLFARAVICKRACVCDLCRLARYKHRTRALLAGARCGDSSRILLCHRSSLPLSLSLSLSLCCTLTTVPPPPHFRATRSVLRSPQLSAFSLLFILLAPTLALSSPFPSLVPAAFSLFPPRARDPSLSSHSRHPIPDTRYLIMLNASGFCGRIMRPRCPHTLFRSPRTAFPLSLSLPIARAPIPIVSLSLSLCLSLRRGRGGRICSCDWMRHEMRITVCDDGCLSQEDDQASP